MRRTVSQDVDSFVVPGGQTFDATGTRGERTISADDVRVEFEMFRHLIPCEQTSAFASVAFRTFLGLSSMVRSCKSVHVRRKGILAFGHHWHRRANGATKIARVTADQRLFNGRDLKISDGDVRGHSNTGQCNEMRKAINGQKGQGTRRKKAEQAAKDESSRVRRSGLQCRTQVDEDADGKIHRLPPVRTQEEGEELQLVR